MTPNDEVEAVVVDTAVLSFFTKRDQLGEAYLNLLGNRRIALSYVARTELEGANWTSQSRLQARRVLIAASIELPQAASTRTWYNRAARMRRQIDLDSGVGDNDLWIIAHAAEHAIPYMTHDSNAGRVALGLGLEVLTLVEISKETRALDREKLSG